MSTDKDYATWVTDYLNDELKGEDKTLFELELDKNQALQEEMKLQKSVNKAIEDHFTSQNEKKLWESYQSLTKDAPIFPEKKTIPMYAKVLSVAAFVSIGVLSLMLVFAAMQNPTEIAKTAIERNTLLGGNTRSASVVIDPPKKDLKQNTESIDIISRLKIIDSYLEEGAYKSAIPELEKAKTQAQEKESPKLFEIKWVLANTYMALKEYDKAITQYQEIIDEQGSYYDEEQNAKVQTAKKNIWILKAKNFF